MIEIKTEYEFIDYMIRNRSSYFEFGILASEVFFNGSLKAVDILGQDNVYYYILEFKRENISEEDFYNIKYIINNNKYDKPMKGLLIGTKISDNLLEKINLEKDIDYLIPSNVVYNKNCIANFKGKYKIEDYSETIFLRFFFACSTGGYNIKLTYKDEYLIINCKLRNKQKADIIIKKDKFRKYMNCSLSVFEKHKISNSWYTIGHYDKIRLFEMDNILFYFENKKYIDIIIKNNINIKDDIDIKNDNKFISLLRLILRYMDIYTLKENLKYNMIDIDQESGIMIINNNLKYINSNYYIVPLKYSNIFKNKVENRELTSSHYYYNDITILESTCIIFKNKLYKPLIKSSYNDMHIKLNLIITLSNNKKITKQYKRKSVKLIKNPEFYLISDIDIILDFEKQVTKHIKNKIQIEKKYEEFVGTVKYKKFQKYKEKSHNTKTIRDIIKEFK